jgi:DNA modification methylase
MVASELQRNYVGIDISKEYVELSKERIKNSQKQRKLDFK